MATQDNAPRNQEWVNVVTTPTIAMQSKYVFMKTPWIHITMMAASPKVEM
jgi:hypothetical protein